MNIIEKVKMSVRRSSTRVYCFKLLMCIYIYIKLKNRDSVVSIAIGYWLDDRGIGVRDPVRSRIFSSPRRPDGFWYPPSPLSNEYRGLFLRVKAAGA
jgi:hypothetical protein